MNDRIKGFCKRVNRFGYGVLFGVMLVGVISCSVDNLYFGASMDEINEEINKSIFEVDSLLMTIELMYQDSLAK